ncbi:unnamed protein product, partial [Prorocentrum cordatum]
DLPNAEKPSWLLKFMLDPTTGGVSATSVTTVGKDEINEDVTQWLTKQQLGGPLYLNCPQHAIYREISKRSERSSVEAQSSMSADDYTKIRRAMCGERINDTPAVSNGATEQETDEQKKAREKAEKRAEKERKEREENEKNPEAARLKEAKKFLGAQITAAKSAARGIHAELSEAPSLVSKLQKKGYPDAMSQFLSSNAAAQRTAVDNFCNVPYTVAKEAKSSTDTTPEYYMKQGDDLKAALNTLQ